MKINRYISIDFNLNQKLEGINASELINNLLLSYFNENTEEKLQDLIKKEREIKQILKENRRKLKLISSKIDKTTAKEKYFASIFDDLHPEQKEWLLHNKKPSLIVKLSALKYIFKGWNLAKLDKILGSI